jgi:mono/diheme cytochrome c family protein
LLSIAIACVLIPVAATAYRFQEKSGAVVKRIKLPADNHRATLKPGAGADAAAAYCGVCHSTDYIVTQPPMDEKQWAAEVNKMVSVYGAQIDSQTAQTIASYIAQQYGKKDGSGPR